MSKDHQDLTREEEREAMRMGFQCDGLLDVGLVVVLWVISARHIGIWALMIFNHLRAWCAGALKTRVWRPALPAGRHGAFPFHGVRWE